MVRTGSHKFTVREAVQFALALTPTPQTNQPLTHRHIPLRDATYTLPASPKQLFITNIAMKCHLYNLRFLSSDVSSSHVAIQYNMFVLLSNTAPPFNLFIQQIITLEIQNFSPPPNPKHQANKFLHNPKLC